MFSRSSNWNEANLCIVLCERTSEIQDGSSETGNNKYLYLSLYKTKLHNSDSNTHVLKVNEFNVAISHIVRCKRK